MFGGRRRHDFMLEVNVALGDTTLLTTPGFHVVKLYSLMHDCG